MTTQTPAASGARYQVTIPGSTDELGELALHRHGAPRWLGIAPDQVVGPLATFALPGDNYVAGTIVEVDDDKVMVQLNGRRATITFERHTSSAVSRRCAVTELLQRSDLTPCCGVRCTTKCASSSHQSYLSTLAFSISEGRQKVFGVCTNSGFFLLSSL